MAHLPCFWGSHLWLNVHYVSLNSPPRILTKDLPGKGSEASSEATSGHNREQSPAVGEGLPEPGSASRQPCVLGPAWNLSHRKAASPEDHKWALGALNKPS